MAHCNFKILKKKKLLEIKIVGGFALLQRFSTPDPPVFRHVSQFSLELSLFEVSQQISQS